MNGQFQVAQATGTGNSNNAAPVRIYKLTKPLTDQAVVVNLGYDQKVQVDFSSIANEKITLVHIGEKLIILFDNQSTVTVEPFFASRADALAGQSHDAVRDGITVEMAPGHDISVQEFASLFPITTDASVLPAADNGGNTNGNAQATGANFSPFSVDPLDPVPTNQLAGQEELPNFTVDFPTGFVPTQPTAPAPTISAGVLPELAVDESFLTIATNGIAGSLQAPAGSTVASGLVPFAVDAPAGQQSLTYALSISAVGVDTGLIDSQTGNHVFLFLENGQVVGREGANSGAAAGGLADFTVSVDAAGSITLTDLRSVHELTPGNSNEGISLAAGLISLTATVTDNNNQTASASVDVGPHLTILDDGPLAPTISVSGTEPVLLTFDGGLASGNFHGTDAVGDLNPSLTVAAEDFAGVFTLASSNAGADGGGTTFSYALAFASGFGNGNDTGLTHDGQHIYLYDVGGVFVGSTSLAAPGSAVPDASTVFELSMSGSQVTLTQYATLDQPSHNAYSGAYINDTVSLGSNILNVVATATTMDNDGDTATGSNAIDLGGHVTFGDDGPSITGGAAQSGAVDEGGLVPPADTHGTGNDTGAATSYTSAADSLSALVSFGADGANATPFQFVDGATANAVIAGLGLTSHGYAVNGASVNGNVLTATDSNGDHVFTLTLNANNSWTFTLLDVHAPGAAGSSDGRRREPACAFDRPVRACAGG